MHWLLKVITARECLKIQVWEVCRVFFFFFSKGKWWSYITGRRDESPLCPPPHRPGGYGGAKLNESDPRNEVETSPSWWLWTSNPCETRSSGTEQLSRRTWQKRKRLKLNYWTEDISKKVLCQCVYSGGFPCYTFLRCILNQIGFQ